VKHPFDLDRFFSFLGSQSIDLSETQKDQLSAYLNLIKKRSVRQNLVSSNDIPHLVERHFLPSAFLFCCLPGDRTGKVIDIGSGAGFPGIILKILSPEISLTLLDSSYKKVLFLEEVCEQLDLDCTIINQRCEDYKPDDSACYKIIVSRAVARLNLLWKWSSGLITSDSQFFVLKGGDLKEEIDELSEYHLQSTIIAPGADWLAISDFLNHKYIVKMEK
jgi:16S rRNA (guanine527-N7)-methyltransferase